MQIYTFASEKSNLKRMSKKIELKKGLTINLVGEAEKLYASVNATDHYVVKPTDFHGLTPKLTVQIGDKVKAGSPLFFDKYKRTSLNIAPKNIRPHTRRAKIVSIKKQQVSIMK